VKPWARGACPGIAKPMPTGDGLLARLLSAEPLPIATWLALCDASERHGNGIIEVTQRGNLQFRGLSESSVAEFSRSLFALGLGAVEHPAMLVAPLLGLTADEPALLRELIERLRRELPAAVATLPVGPKVSLIVDGSGSLHLDAISADLRLRFSDDASRVQLSLAGDAASARPLGWTEAEHVLAAIVAVFAAISRAGLHARARDLSRETDLQVLRSMLPCPLSDAPPPPPRPPAEPIGMHRLSDTQVALGVSPAFGHSESGVLRRLAETAARCGARAIRPAPGRALLAIGLDSGGAEQLAAEAAASGFIVDPRDARRFVFACAGAPACGSARLDTRALAPRVAAATAHRLDPSMTIHVSGCPKGCAHPGPAALTLVGPDQLVVDGRADDRPQAHISADDFVASLRRRDSTQWRRELLAAAASSASQEVQL